MSKHTNADYVAAAKYSAALQLPDVFAMALAETAFLGGVRYQRDKDQQDAEGKNPHATALGRLGGLKGGHARTRALSAKRRREIARKAARTRWSKR